VALVPLIPGDDGALLDLARPRFEGVVVQAFGRGNVPPGVLPAIGRWQEDGKPVVLATRCPFGEVGGEYAFEGGGGQLLRMGVIPAGPRTASHARLELALALSAGVPYGGGLA
jgi:L-asparaginase